MLGADGGLFIGTFSPLSLIFPPLQIPSADIAAAPQQGVFVPVVALEFAKAPKVRFSVTEGLGRRLLVGRLF